MRIRRILIAAVLAIGLLPRVTLAPPFARPAPRPAPAYRPPPSYRPLPEYRPPSEYKSLSTYKPYDYKPTYGDNPVTDEQAISRYLRSITGAERESSADAPPLFTDSFAGPLRATSIYKRGSGLKSSFGLSAIQLEALGVNEPWRIGQLPGRGDNGLILPYGGKEGLLLDSGSDKETAEYLKELESAGLILTHPHSDHSDGLMKIARTRAIKSRWIYSPTGDLTSVATGSEKPWRALGSGVYALDVSASSGWNSSLPPPAAGMAFLGVVPTIKQVGKWELVSFDFGKRFAFRKIDLLRRLDGKSANENAVMMRYQAPWASYLVFSDATPRTLGLLLGDSSPELQQFTAPASVMRWMHHSYMPVKRADVEVVEAALRQLDPDVVIISGRHPSQDQSNPQKISELSQRILGKRVLILRTQSTQKGIWFLGQAADSRNLREC